MPLTKKKPSAADLFSVPPRRFTDRISTHSDERGCHADCRACGWRNPAKQDKAKRDRAAWDHEKSCKAAMPKKKRGLRKKKQPRVVAYTEFDLKTANRGACRRGHQYVQYASQVSAVGVPVSLSPRSRTSSSQDRTTTSRSTSETIRWPMSRSTSMPSRRECAVATGSDLVLSIIEACVKMQKLEFQNPGTLDGYNGDLKDLDDTAPRTCKSGSKKTSQRRRR